MSLLLSSALYDITLGSTSPDSAIDEIVDGFEKFIPAMIPQFRDANVLRIGVGGMILEQSYLSTEQALHRALSKTRTERNRHDPALGATFLAFQSDGIYIGGHDVFPDGTLYSLSDFYGWIKEQYLSVSRQLGSSFGTLGFDEQLKQLVLLAHGNNDCVVLFNDDEQWQLHAHYDSAKKAVLDAEFHTFTAVREKGTLTPSSAYYAFDEEGNYLGGYPVLQL